MTGSMAAEDPFTTAVRQATVGQQRTLESRPEFTPRQEPRRRDASDCDAIFDKNNSEA